MNELISIIIPVYNAETFIETCIKSLCSQTYEDLEILVIDDGSKDNSLTVCQALARQDKRIVVLHQENQGVSAARNFGLEKATGAYVSFMDADDYVKPDYIEVMYRDIKEHDADMTCCDMIEMQDGKQVFLSDPRVRTSRLVTDPQELYRDLALQKEGYGNTVWAKLIKAELAKKHKYPCGIKYGEDQIYIYLLFSEAPKVYLNTYAGYYYIRNDASATLRKVNNHINRYMDEIAAFRYKALNLPACAKSQTAGFYEIYAKSVTLAASEIALKGSREDWLTHYGKLKERMEEIPVRMLSRKTGAKIMMLRYFPRVFCFAYKMKNKSE